MSEEGEQQQQQQQEEQPPSPQQEDSMVATTNSSIRTATVDMSTLPLQWTQMGVPVKKKKNTDDNDNAQDEDDDEEEEEATPKIRFPHDVAEISPDDLEITVVGTAGQKITHLPIDFSNMCHSELRSLVLRSHLISKMKGFDKFTSMELLELYDNQVQELESLEGPGPSLRVLDMSYNAIRDMSPVAICTNLQELYLANNKLKSIAGLSALVNLKKVDLGANRIRVMEATELAGLTNLEELWIGKNKIEKIEGLENLTKLRRLDIQSNRLTKVENLLTQQSTLEELYLAHNGIDDEGASCETGLALDFPKLNVLDLGRNRLTSTKPFAHLKGLEELWLSGNQMETMDAVLPLKEASEAGIQSLETIYLEYNPLSKEFEYRKRLKEWIPSLQQIDADMIRPMGMAGTMSTTLRPTMMTPEQLQQAALDRARQEMELKQAETKQQDTA